MPDTLRGCIIAADGFTLISLDASQVELRVLAYESGDTQMIEDLKTGDIHMATATRMFGFTEDEAEMKSRRYKGKQGNFADVYGIQDDGLAALLECSLEEVAEFRATRKATYPQLYKWMNNVKVQAGQDGYVVNMFGRVRPIPELHSASRKMREKARRETVNTLVQGTAVDIVKIAGLYLRDVLDYRVRFILQVHDEWLLECPDELLDESLVKCRTLGRILPQYPFNITIGKVYNELKEVSNEDNK